jgi:hypothetical protein
MLTVLPEEKGVYNISISPQEQNRSTRKIKELRTARIGFWTHIPV